MTWGYIHFIKEMILFDQYDIRHSILNNEENLMLEGFFLTVNTWIGSGTAIAGLGCFLWGMISVIFSPCHLASIPLIVAYVGGQEKVLKIGRAHV